MRKTECVQQAGASQEAGLTGAVTLLPGNITASLAPSQFCKGTPSRDELSSPSACVEEGWFVSTHVVAAS